MERCEHERDDLRRDLAIREEEPQVIADTLPDALPRFRDLIVNLETSVEGNIPRARSLVQALVGGEIKLHPIGDSYLEAELTGDYAGLISLINENPGSEAGALELSMVAGARNCLKLLLLIKGIEIGPAAS